MRKLAASFLVCAALLATFTACGAQKEYKDGTYTARMEQFDSRGYQDYIIVTVEDGTVTAIEYDGLDENGNLKSEDDKYASDMVATQDTYPSRYSTDLVNQYIESQSIEDVDALAGATYSYNSFVALFTALEKNMQSGDTTPITVENIADL